MKKIFSSNNGENADIRYQYQKANEILKWYKNNNPGIFEIV
jgi:hypothetical protein